MRVRVVDPSSYTRPYDHALCSALARAGADVELVAGRFRHGPAPSPDGYALREDFYGEAASRAGKLARHVPAMLALRRAPADVTHFQWLAVQHVDGRLLPREPVVLTAHDVLPRRPRAGQRAAQRRLYGRVAAVVVHTEHGARRLTGELGVPADKVRVIPHGVLDGLAAVKPSLPPELPDPGGRPVALFFGLLKPYKGVDVLLDAWRDAPPGAELWVVGAPRMDLSALRAAAPAGVRWVPRFVSDAEAAAVLRRATVVVLPYRETEQSGVLWSAVGLGRPVLATDVGGFAEVEGLPLVAPGDPEALGAALRAALDDPPAPIDPTPYAWDPIARRHLELYAEITS